MRGRARSFTPYNNHHRHSAANSEAELGFSSRRGATQTSAASTPMVDVEGQLIAYAGAVTLGVLVVPCQATFALSMMERRRVLSVWQFRQMM